MKPKFLDRLEERHPRISAKFSQSIISLKARMRTRITKYVLFWLVTALTPASAADIRFVGSESFVSLRLQGQIEPGDLDRMVIALGQAQGGLAAREFFWQRQILWVDSPGGSVEEALKIAEFVRKSMIPVWVLNKCESACFLIVAAAVERQLGGRVGIHRPYFTNEASRKMSIEESRQYYTQMATRFYSALESYEVPRQIIDRMRSFASDEVYYLNGEEKELLGSRQPWFEQMLIAKCGLDKNREFRVNQEIQRRLKQNDLQWRTPPDYRKYQEEVVRCTRELTYKTSSEVFFSEGESVLRRLNANAPAPK